MDNIKQLAP